MAIGTLGIALTGLAAAQAGIRTTEHNISNINTAGFRRQEVAYAALNPGFSGTYYGSGVGVTTVRNLYSQFQDSQVLLDQAQLSRNEAYATLASQVDAQVGDANSGMTSAIDAFFSATQTVATDPTSNAARQVMLSSGRNLSARFNTLSTAFTDANDDINREIAATVIRVNSYTSQISTLSTNIARLEGGTGQPANDLRDQRDQLVSELNKLINVTPVQQTDGAFNLYVGSGQPLVVGNSVTTMTSVSDSTTPEFDVPALNMAGGVTQSLDASMISGGKLGGLMAVRDDILHPAMQDLDRLAMVFADQFNTQHTLAGAAFDKFGVQGVNFFTSSSLLFQQPAALPTNAPGSPAITATLSNSSQLVASDYELSFDGATYTLTRLSDGASSPAAAVATINGVQQGFTLAVGAGVAVAGDRWLIRPSHGAAGTLASLISDPNLIAASSTSAGSPGNNVRALALADLQTDPTINGQDTFSSAYAQLVSRTATLASEADINVAAYETLASQSKAAQQAISGVNLDEEAANLIRFQQAYQASAKAMQVASSLFDELIGILR